MQGLFYLGIDEESSSSNLITDDLGIYGTGEYIIRQGVGGAGFGLDIGVVSKPINGWKFGASLINASSPRLSRYKTIKLCLLT